MEIKTKQSMLKLNQSHKITISVVAIFMVSLSVMLFLLNGQTRNLGHLQANVSHSGESGEVNVKEQLLEEYKSFFKDSGEIIFSTGPEGKFKYASDGFCELIDKDCSLLPGELFFDYVNSDDLVDLASKYAKIIKEENDLSGIGPYRMREKKGDDEFLVMFDVHVVIGTDKKLFEVVFSVKDITKKVDEMRDEKPEKSDLNSETSKIAPQSADSDSDSGSDSDSKEENNEGGGTDGRPGDTRLMVEKISSNMRLLEKLF